MHDHNTDEHETDAGHATRCPCADCDPDAYIDARAEVLAGQPDERW